MKRNVRLIYDGCFDGFLTCVFSVYEEKLNAVEIQVKGINQNGFFSEFQEIITDTQKAKRVWRGLTKRISPTASREIYFAFLSELPGIEISLLKYIEILFLDETKTQDYADINVLKITQTAKKVAREKHRMEAFVRFMLTKDEIYFAHIEPDFNVLPVIKKHFKNRYADQQWIIYDLQRNYGLFYNLKEVQHISLDINPKIFSKEKSAVFNSSEIQFQKLWQDYFKSTNIVSRKNTTLHLQHVPKRYWKYLTEKTTLQK